MRYFDPDHISTALNALITIGPMSNHLGEWDRKSTEAVQRQIGCTSDDARALWKAIRDQNRADVISDYTGPGFERNGTWRWLPIWE
jgi:hypothetical protein